MAGEEAEGPTAAPTQEREHLEALAAVRDLAFMEAQLDLGQQDRETMEEEIAADPEVELAEARAVSGAMAGEATEE